MAAELGGAMATNRPQVTINVVSIRKKVEAHGQARSKALRALPFVVTGAVLFLLAFYSYYSSNGTRLSYWNVQFIYLLLGIAGVVLFIPSSFFLYRDVYRSLA